MKSYLILQYVGPFVPDQSVPSSEFPEGTDFNRLIRLGAIQEIDPASVPDAPNVAGLKKSIAALQASAKDADAANAILQSQLSDATSEIEGLKTQLSAVTAERDALKASAPAAPATQA